MSFCKYTDVFEKILINLGGYKPTHLGMLESPYVRYGLSLHTF